MLDPHNRRHLIETLRPPPGYRLDFAIGTTFSLDLLALLVTPLAFTFFDWEADGAQGRPTADPLALLEALRRNADRIAIFCEAGQIAVPPDSQLLFAYLEGAVFEAAAPRGGSFHPKLWLLRFADEHGRTVHRLLCLSRNLTFDRSWDTVLVLDGVPAETDDAGPDTAPLGAFLSSLPDLVVRRKVPELLRQRIAQLQAELRGVRFELPTGFDQLRFHPLGVPGAAGWPFGRNYDRLLVIAPFVTAGCLERLAGMARESQLVSRLDELQKLEPTTLAAYRQVYTLSPAAEPEDAGTEAASEQPSEVLAGLHAKLYVADAGERAHVWTGSANASDAAFANNVECLVELAGPRRLCGVEAVLGEDHEVGLRALLEPFVPAAQAEPVDALQQALEDLADYARRRIASLGLHAHVVGSDAGEHYAIELRLDSAQSLALPSSVSVLCWPVTLKAHIAQPFHMNAPLACFTRLSFEALTSFYAFTVTARAEGREFQRHFVLNLPLVGAPANRRERLLRSLLQNREQVLRFLLLLLSDDGTELSGLLQATALIRGKDGAQTAAGAFGLPLFEAMVRALDRDPDKLDSIARLVADLRTTPEGQQLLPETFDTIWEPILQARKGLLA
jgi:hypothetical protein